MPITVGCLLQILLAYKKHGDSVITIEADRLVIRNGDGVISLEIVMGTGAN